MTNFLRNKKMFETTQLLLAELDYPSHVLKKERAESSDGILASSFVGLAHFVSLFNFLIKI